MDFHKTTDAKTKAEAVQRALHQVFSHPAVRALGAGGIQEGRIEDETSQIPAFLEFSPITPTGY